MTVPLKPWGLCLCCGRDDIVCNDTHCDIACPGQPGNENQCHVCWLRLGKPNQKCRKSSHSVRVREIPRRPGLLLRLRYFLTSIWIWAKDGFRMASKSLAQERLSICEKCLKPDGYYNPETKTCELCTCNMPVKVTLKAMKCPIGKW